MSLYYMRTSRFLIPAAFALWLIFLPTLAGPDTDTGNIAVIEADATILQPGELFDLNNQTLTFTPKSGGGYTVGVGALDFNASLGTDLGLGDDSFVSQALSFTFPFFGMNRTSVFVNSNGYLTFGSGSSFIHFNAGGGVSGLGDTSTVLNRMAGGFQRMAVLWQDWNPSAGGGVFANSLSDRLIITWSGVPLFNTSTTATFQVILFNTGVIQMNYQSVTTTPGGGYLTGISPGSVSQFLVTTIDLSQGSGSSISTFPNFEPLVQVFGSSSSPLVHISAVSRRFFNTHGDDFDQFVMFANFTHAMGSAFAFEFTVNQAVTGIGLGTTNIFSFFGSSGKMQSFLNMNRLNLYPADPNTDLLGTNNTLDIMAQETGHQWLAFVQFDNGGVCSNLLLGRDLAHWSFFHDTDASDEEGNSWVDNSNGTFTSDEATERFSALDQYIMGLRSAAEVPSFFFINNPTNTGGRTSSSAPAIGVTVNGTRQNVTVNQIQTCEGSRSPSSGFTAVNQTTTWKQAFVLLIPEGTTAPSGDVTKIDTIRTAWVSYFNTGTDGRGSVDTTLPNPVISVTPSSRDFGSVNVGSSTDQTFTVTNTGTGTLSGSASTSAPFSIVSGGSYSLGAGASQTVTVRFSPTSAGVSMGNVTFTGAGGATATLTGTGAPPSTLTVTRAGSDSGMVTSSPAGINCGSDCTETYNSGTSVTLTASPAGGSTFAGWSGGGCSGTGTCMVTMNADTTVTATYSKIFTDDPLTSQVTPIKAVHITELREAINTLRSNNGLGAFSFTDSTLTGGVTQVRAVHLTDLRTALDGVYDALTLTRPSYTDATIVAGATVIKKVHISEIRSAVRDVE